MLIIGATDGLGLELAGRYWRSGAAVTGVGRRPVDEGQERLGQFGVYCQADLSRPGATDQVALHLEEQAIRALDRVILNAAVGSYGPVEANPVRTEHARRYSPDNSREHRRLCPDALAVQMLGARSRGRATLVPGLCNRIVARVGALVPAATEVLLARTLFSKMLGSSQNAVQTNGPKPQENIR